MLYYLSFELEIINSILKKAVVEIEDVIKYKYVSKEFYKLLNKKYYYQFILNDFMKRYKMLEAQARYFENKVKRLDFVLHHDYGSDDDLPYLINYYSDTSDDD